MDWQEKKDVLLKALFDRDVRRKKTGPPGVRYKEIAAAIGISEKEARELVLALERDGYVKASFDSCFINVDGAIYVRENDCKIGEVWQKYKNNKLENLGEK